MSTEGDAPIPLAAFRAEQIAALDALLAGRTSDPGPEPAPEPGPPPGCQGSASNPDMQSVAGPLHAPPCDPTAAALLDAPDSGPPCSLGTPMQCDVGSRADGPDSNTPCSPYDPMQSRGPGDSADPRKKGHRLRTPPGGRPSKATVPRVLAVLAAIREGVNRGAAARSAGVTKSTLMLWLARSRAGDPALAGLAGAVERAEADHREDRRRAAQAERDRVREEYARLRRPRRPSRRPGSSGNPRDRPA